MKDVLNRSLSVGDYFLYCLVTERLNKSVVGKVEMDSQYYIYVDGKSYCVSDNSRDVKVAGVYLKVFPKNVYKLNGDKSLYNSLYKKGISMDEMFRQEKTPNKIKDICGRAVATGDFVAYKIPGAFTKSNVFFGVVIDDHHILTSDNVNKTCGYVFKLTDRDQYEEELYRKAISFYNALIRSRLQANKKTLQVGNMYRKLNMQYVYLGFYNVKIHDTIGCLHAVAGKDMFLQGELYLVFDLKRKGEVAFLNKLLADNYTSLTEYIKNSGSMVMPYRLTLITKHMNRSSCGDCIGHIDVKPTDYVYENKKVKIYYSQFKREK